MLLTNRTEGLYAYLDSLFNDAEEIVIACAYLSPGACETVGLLKRAAKVPMRLAIGRGLVEGLPQPTWNYLKRLDETARRLGGGVRFSENGFNSRIYATQRSAVIGSSNLTEYGLGAWKECNIVAIGEAAGLVRDEARVLFEDSVNLEEADPHLLEDVSLDSGRSQDRIVDIPAEPGSFTTALSISLLDRSGNVPEKSGLNWGLAGGRLRDRYECYVRMPTSVLNKAGEIFGSVDRGTKFVANTHDGRTLRLRIEGNSTAGENIGKQISTLGDKTLLGRWMVGDCLGKTNEEAVSLDDLARYGRTDVMFYRTGTTSDGLAIVYMDFSSSS